LNWFSVLTLVGALQGILLFFSVNGLKRGDRSANRIAATFILCISITLCGRWAYSVTPPTLTLVKILFIGDSVIFFFGPLLYLYFLKLFRSVPRHKVRTWIHFVPLAVFLLAVLPFMFLDRATFIAQSTKLRDMFSVLEFMAVCQNAFYLIINFRLVKSFQENSYQVSSFAPQVRFYKLLLGVVFLGLIFWTVSFGMRIFDPAGVHDYLGYHLVWIGLSGMVIGLGYYILRYPEVFSVPELKEPEAKPPGIQNLDDLGLRIDAVMKEKRPFLEPRLTLPALSEITGINQHLLSRVINEKFGKNFFEFVNSYRVEEFKRLATSEKLKNMTLLALAMEAGFNSKSTFNTAFKKIAKQTPREFHRSLQV
jgi:AraC-like DNA-binding protein